MSLESETLSLSSSSSPKSHAPSESLSSPSFNVSGYVPEKSKAFVPEQSSHVSLSKS